MNTAPAKSQSSETRTQAAARILEEIRRNDGRINLLDGKLFCGPREVATQHAAEITEYKTELVTLLTDPQAKSSSQLALEAVQRGECPDCDEKLDLQSRNHGVVWWCPDCRTHFIEADFQLAKLRAIERPAQSQRVKELSR